MAEIARWNGHIFEISHSLVRSFSELTIKGSCETEQNEDGDKVESRKGSLPAEITLTINLHASVGVDVRNEAMSYVDQAAWGSSDYIYVGGYKLVPHRMMLTEANVTEVSIAPNGRWVAASVSLTLKQCQVDGGSSSTPGSVAGSAANVGFEPSKQTVNSGSAASSSSSSSSSSQSHLQEAQASISGIISAGRAAS